MLHVSDVHLWRGLASAAAPTGKCGAYDRVARTADAESGRVSRVQWTAFQHGKPGYKVHRKSEQTTLVVV